jgi:hypothetical protein
MAEIRDVYSIEFDASGFESAVNNAIAQIEELNAATEESAASTQDLNAATNNLTNVLKTNASGIDGLNSKRDVLVRTQKDLNKESAAFTAVGNEINNTNKKIATTTGNVTTRSRGLFQTYLRGARNLNTVRRSVSLLNGAFRALAGVSVFGLILQAAPAVISFFRRLTGSTESATESNKRLAESQKTIVGEFVKETQSLNNLFGALNEANKGRGDKKQIIDAINSRYGKYLENINLEKAGQKELELAYRAVATEIARGIIQREKERIGQASRERQLNLLVERKKLQEELVDIEEQVRIGTERLNSAQGKRASILDKNQTALKSNIQNLERQERQQKKVEKSISDLDKEIETTRKDLDRLDDVADEFAKTLADSTVVEDLTGSIEDTGKASADASKKVEILSGSIADLERQLSALEKQQREQTAADPEALKAIQQQIDAQRKRVDEAKKILTDIRGIADAENNIERLKTELIENETERRIEQLRKRAEKEIDAVIGSEQQKAIQEKLIREKLFRDIQEIRQKSEDELLKEIKTNTDKNRQILETAASDELELLVNNENAKLNIRLASLERQRNAELDAIANSEQTAEQRNAAVENVNKDFDRRRVELEKNTQSEIIRIQISAIEKRIQNLEKFGESTSAERAELSKLRLELVELERTDPTVTVDVKTEDAETKLSDLVNQIADGTQQISDAIFNALTAQVQAVAASLDDAVNRSRSALDQIRNDSENFNARQLELEKQRLEKLEAERARAVEREKTIALTQLTVNSLLAISKAAAEGGAAAPFTIASTLIALLAGFASARTAASNAFFDGTEYVDPHGQFPAGRDTVPARLNKGERVITTKTNRQYWDVLSAIHNKRIPADVLNDFARGYMRDGSVPGIMSEVGQNIIIVPNANSNSGMEKRLERIEDVLLNLPSFMPRTTIKGNADGMFTVIEKRRKYANFANNRAK